MRTLFLLLTLIIWLPSLAQEEGTKDNRNFRFGFGMNISADFLDPARAEDYGIAKTGMTWIDMYIRFNILKYVNIDGGLAVSNFKDKMPFTEAVVFTQGSLSGLPSEAKSSIVSGGFYYSIGTSVTIAKKFSLIGEVGQWNFSASRKITQCSDCSKTELGTTAGPYAQVGIGLPQQEDSITGEFYVTYTQFFSDDFRWAVGIGFTLLY